MDSIRALPGPTAPGTVRDRAAGGGSRQQADAFRQAMREEGGDGAATERDETPVRPGLQRRPPASRREAQTAGHVDVIA